MLPTPLRDVQVESPARDERREHRKPHVHPGEDLLAEVPVERVLEREDLPLLPRLETRHNDLVSMVPSSPTLCVMQGMVVVLR